MKKTVFIQTLPHYPTPWGDATASWNLASFFKGMGTWTARAYSQKLKFWTRQNFNIILDIDRKHPDKILLKHFMVPISPSGKDIINVIDMQTAFDYLDQDAQHRTCAFGAFFDPANIRMDHEFIINHSEWFTRSPHELVVQDESQIEEGVQRKFCRLPTNEIITNNDNPAAIVWFFVYRALDLPIYYVIPNPDLLGVSFNFNDTENNTVRYMTIDPHFGSIGDVIFRPSFSSNVIQMTPTKITAGEEFDITPFEQGVFQWGFKEKVPPVPLKVLTNLNFVLIPNTNKIHFKFDEHQTSGYVHIRWNSTALMDFAQSSRSLDNLQNKCHITLDVYRHNKYKYHGET